MTRPTASVFAAFLADRDLGLPQDRLEGAAATHAKLRHELEKLRSVRLDYLPPYIEPATALQWIERGGRSLDADE